MSLQQDCGESFTVNNKNVKC